MFLIGLASFTIVQHINPSYKAVFGELLENGWVQKDWMLTNVASIFKKREKEDLDKY